MQYCKRCVMPDTHPDMPLDAEGVCPACRSYEKRADVDWAERMGELRTILDRYRSRDGSNWDCIVPVSGGKDSTYQVLSMLELGMNPLCVTGTTCDLSDIGRKNIQNIQNLGVDYVEFTSNRIARRRMNRYALEHVGDISWPEHNSIFVIPVRAAVQFGVPLIIWGENSQNEYGGPAADAENNTLTRHWLERFGGLLGLTKEKLIEEKIVRPQEIIPFTYPTDEELARVGVTGIFLGHYIPWDGYTNALLAQANGFTSYDKCVEGSCVNYENLDNHQTGIHDYFRYLKLGYGRATSLASLHVRRGRMTRSQACDIVRRLDGTFPWEYLGKPLDRILEPLELSVEEFIGICDRWTNRKIFKTDAQGNLVKDKHGNLTKVLYPDE